MTELADLLRSACDRFADGIAIRDAERSLRYRDLADAAAGLADALRQAGLRPHEPVLVRVGNRGADLAAFLGVWQAGGVIVPVHAGSPAAVLAATQAATAARFVVDGAVERVADAPPPERPLLEGAASIVFTSGSTGAPKGVVLSHRAFAGKLRAIDERLNLAEGARSLLVLQITFSYGVWFSLLTLLKGGTLFMRPKFEADAVLSAMVEDGITEAAFVPTMLRGFLALPEAERPRLEGLSPDLRRLATGGEPLSATLGRDVRALFGGRGLVDIYGLTETCTCDFFVQAEEQDALAGAIGRPSPGVAFRIADAGGLAVAAGEVGELQIRSPFLMNGYLDQPELTAAALADGFFRTGDLARQRPDGAVELVGRAKEIISRAGNKIAPLEIDAVAAGHPAVAGALATGLPDPLLGESLHLLVVPRAGATLDEQALRAWLAERLQKYKLPDAIHFAAALPTGRTGKVDRGRLRQMLLDRDAADPAGVFPLHPPIPL